MTLDLGFPNVPVDAIEVQSTTDTFVRRAVVEGSNNGTTYVPLGGAEVARYRGVDLDRIPVDGRQRYVRVTIVNGDDAPLAGLRVRALARDRRLVLAEGFTPPYRLLYGAPGLAAPAYDFARLPASAIGLDRARESQLGGENSTRTSSLRSTRARSSRGTRTSSTGCSSSRRSSLRSVGFSLSAAGLLSRGALRPAEELASAVRIRWMRRLLLVGILRLPLGREDADHRLGDPRRDGEDREDVHDEE